MGRQWLHAKRAIVNQKKGQTVGKLVKEITVAAKLGGGDPAANARLFAALEKARKASVTRDVIERAIKKGSGGGEDKLVLEHIVFEGYAPHKVPVIVEVYTDNHQRTAPELRQLFKRGVLGQAGSNKFLFDHVGLVEAHHPDLKTDLEAAAIEAGANDFEALTHERNDDIPEGRAGARFITDRTAVHLVSTWLASHGWSVVTSELGHLAKAYPELDDAGRAEVGEFLQALEDHDDVQRVWAAVEMSFRTLVVGAGATGGYFGGRLLEAGRDVTFLVRPRRAAQLAEIGLVIRSAKGDYHRPGPPTVSAEALRAPFDLVLLSCKAYDLENAIASVAGAVGPETAVLPVLNGMRHLESLDRHFGAGRVLGGLCVISATLGEQGAILHRSEVHGLAFGERDGARSARVEAIAAEFAGARCDARASAAIVQEMWEKWVFIAAGAGITSLMRGPIGDLVAAGGADQAAALLEECAAIATAQGFAPGEASRQRSRAMLTAPGSAFVASMLRDIERGGPTEVEHILGDLLRRRGAALPAAPLLRAAYLHVAAYEVRRTRA